MDHIKILLILPLTKKMANVSIAVAVMLDHKEIGINPERIAKRNPFIGIYNCEDTDFPSEKRWLEKVWKS